VKWFARPVFLSILATAAHAAVYNATPSNYTAVLPSLRAGDTLNLAAGNYPFLRISGLNGSASAWITIAGPTGGSPARVYAPSSCCNTVQITNSSYVAIRNLTIDSAGLAYVDGLNAKGGTSNLTHHILVEGNTFIGQNGHQQTVGISTKTPTWGWTIRNNVIDGAGTGMYLGDSDGSSPFIGGVIEDNLIRNTIGYNLQIKYQTARPTVTGMPTAQSLTIIRNNVFVKDDQPSPDGDRPNLLVGGFPDTGAGSTDMYEIYGNFFFHNPRESLLQAEGRVSIHDNVFVDAAFSAVNLQYNRAPLQIAYLYNNTIYTAGNYGIYAGTTATVDHAVIGNLIFAGAPIGSRLTNVSNNITDTSANAGLYVNTPSFTPGSMDFYPLAGKATGAALDLSKFAADPDYLLDFNGASKGAPAVFRGAYAGAGSNPGWRLQAAIKPAVDVPLLTGVQCQPATLSSGSAAQCSVTLSGAATANTAVAIAATGPVSTPSTVTVASGAAAASFTATAGAVSTSQQASVVATLNGVAQSASLTVTSPVAPQPGVSSLSCSPAAIASGASTSCTVTLTLAPSAPAAVAISTSDAALEAPASTTVPAGALTTTFTAAAGTVSSTRTVAVSASLNGVSATFQVAVQPPAPAAAFYFKGNAAEAPLLANGAAVTATTAPAGLAGRVVVRGTGAVTYSPLPNGDGLSFTKGGAQNSNTALIAFTGTAVGALFNLDQGDLSFSVKSHHSFADRGAVLPGSTVFHADDGSRRIAYFSCDVYNSRMVFHFGAAGANGYYYVPAGQENTFFGQGVVAEVRLAWSNTSLKLYLNGNLAATFGRTPITPSWKSTASFTIGATSLNYFGGGYYATDDSVADFTIR
jgi:hypothetical protein